ncbi:cadherin-like beta sandwich domain-containing protein [Mucilaginibacter dorajii]|nr:cadherin-like beta sandwich domain-containing protein [Mucilaginibacter dorajii]MCS3732494.1 gliding motility-associated-like protein [Mucilaginibacter dorajii]
MKKTLLFPRGFVSKHLRFLTFALLLIAVMGSALKSKAQVYYTLNDGTASATSTDGVVRVGYDGTSASTLASSFTALPTFTAYDFPGNRAFVYEGTANALQIRVVNLSSGTLTTTITVPTQVVALRYDAASGYIYYLTTASGSTLAAGDALRKVKPDGTGDALVLASITASPKYLALDLTHGQVIVEDVFATTNIMKVIKISDGSSTTLISNSTPINAIHYNVADNYIYYLTSDGSFSSNGANDALVKIHPDGTGQTTIASSIAASPVLLAVDAGNNRAFIYDGAGLSPTVRAIRKIDLGTGSVSAITNISSLPNSAAITALSVPQAAVISTTAASSITATTATIGGNISQTDESVTERGVVYSSSNTTPTVGTDTKQTIGTGTGTFSASIGSLSVSTTYYLRAYAISSAGTSYGTVVSFSTLSNDATLSGLSLSSGSLNPTFASGTVSYTASVSNSISAITITPTQNQANATIKVNTTIVTSGFASASFNLNIGDNLQTIVVTAQDGSTKTYKVTVNRAKTAQTITFASTASKTYGDANYAPGATASSGLTVSYSSDNTAVATIVSGKIQIVAPGTANITASQAGDANNLAASNVVQALTVNKAAITVTANAGSKIYGDADPSLTYSVTTGTLVGSDAFTGALTRDAGTNIGTYNITQGTLAISSTKYTLTFVSGVLTVNKRAISIQPAPASKSYGDVDPNYPYYYRVGSLASTDGMTGSYVRDPGETPGTYALSIGTKHPVNATTGVDQTNNYDITFLPEYLTITKRAITLQPAPATKVYGDADPGFPYYFRVGSLAPGEGMTGTFGRQPGEDAGVYTLNLGTKRPVNATTGVFTDQYYTISFLPDNLTITKKTVSVNANTLSKNYGDVDPTLTYSSGALGFSDTFGGVLTRAVGESAGIYAISQGSLALNANNYNLNFTGANFTISTKTINVTANAQTKTYGDADPALTYTADALNSGDSFTGALTRIAGETAGSYAINQGSLALNSNYTLNFTGNNLSIGQKTINVTANAQTKTYGDADPALTYTADALLGGDTFTGALTRVAGETAGNYPINQGSLAVNSNYALNYTGNSLTISKVSLSYVATAASKTYLAPNPAFTGTVTGFVNGDTRASATTGTLSFTSTATTSSPQGSYPIIGSGLSAANYDFIQAPANSSALTVLLSPDAALLNISVSQGTLNAPFDAGTYQYLVNVDHNTTSIDLTAVVHQGNATMLVNGMALTSGSAITLPLGAGTNYFTIVVTAQDGTSTQSYLVTVNRAFSTNNLLTNITLSGVTINPVFDPNTTTYTASVGNLVNGTDITATAADIDASAQIGPIKITATTSYHFPLNVGDNSINVDGVAQNGDIKSYNITITRAPSSDASLSSLNTTVLTFNEPFSSTTYNYTATVANNVSQFNFVPVATNNAAIITVNGNTVNYLGVTPTLNYGVNTYTIVVTSEDGTVTKNYTITVTRTLSSDNNLATLSIPYVTTINEPFDPSVLNYTATLADSTITGLPLTAYSYDPNATMKINGTAVARFANYTMTLHGGDNTFNIVVTPQDNSATKTYTLVLTRAGQAPPLFSPDASLVAIAVSGTGYSHNFNFAFDALTPLTVANKITGVRLSPVAGNSGATITVNGVAVAQGNATNLLSLNLGDNTFDIVVTAADGVHQTTTTLHVNRLPAADVSLASLAINGGALSPAFSGTTFTYTASVPYSFSTLNITPVTNAADATVTVGATTISAGAPSASVPLNTGLPNRIRVTVTAADGVNTQVYALNVTRLAPDATLAALTLNNGTLSPAFSGANTNYTALVDNSVSVISVKPVAIDPGLVITVNGVSPDNAGNVNVSLNTGANTITTVVTTPDGIATSTYTLTVSRKGLGSSSVAISDVRISSGTVARVANTDIFNGSVTASTNSTTVLVHTTDSHTTIQINGVTTNNGTYSLPVPLTGYTTSIPVLITAEDGVTTRALTVQVSKTGLGDVSIQGLSISSGLLIRTGSSDTWTASLNTGSITVTATPTDSNASVKVNTVPTGNGVASAPITLNAGINTIPVLITAQDGVTTRAITLVITNLSPDVSIKGLSISPGILVRTGTSDTWTASLTTGSITVTATPTNTNAHVKVNNIETGNGIASAPVILNSGVNTVPVLITAENGTVTRQLTLVLTYVSSDISIKGLSIGSGTLLKVAGSNTWIATVSPDSTTVRITATPANDNAHVKINNVQTGNGIASAPIPLTGFSTNIPVLITAEDGVTTRTLTVQINKSASSDVSIKGLALSSGLLVRTGVTDVWTATVSPHSTTLTVTTTPADNNAIVKVNNVNTGNGVASAAVSLTGYTTSIPVLITAADGVTTRTITIQVSKAGLSDVSIKGLSINTGQLIRSGSADTWTASINAGSINVTATPNDNNASVKVNGILTGNGVASAAVQLSSGITTIPVLITAEDGVTQRELTLLISKSDLLSFATTNITGIAKKSNDITGDQLIVHQALSPNGDGQNDILTIDGIENHTNNHLSIMNAGGVLVYDVKGYGTNGNVFDGHSNKTGTMQKPGTYYYSLEYADGKETKRKTGYIIIKY